MSAEDAQKGLIVHIYGTHRYGILNLVPENAMVYFRVERIFLDDQEVKGENVVLRNLLNVNARTSLLDCENILRINPRKNFANVELRIAASKAFHLRCVDLDYSLFMGGLASSQLEAEAAESTGKKRRRRKRSKSQASDTSPLAISPEPSEPASKILELPESLRSNGLKPPPVLSISTSKPQVAVTPPPAATPPARVSKPLGVVKPPTPPATVTPPSGYINLDGTIRSVHPNNSNFHTISFRFKKDVLIGAFYMQYVAINGSRIRSDELDKIRALLRVGMPAFVIHFKVRNCSDRNIPYLAVVNFRSEVLHSAEWKRKPVDGIVRPVASKPVAVKPVASKPLESVWDMVQEKDIKSCPVRVNQLTNEKVAPALPDGLQVSGIIDKFNALTNRGVATFRHNDSTNMARFSLKQTQACSEVKVGMKVALLIKNAPLGAEYKYEGEGVVSEGETFPNDRIFQGVVVETISSEGSQQPRIVAIHMAGRRENVFISMRNVKVDDKRLGGSALPQGFCKVGMKVKVSHLKVYSKSCKYEGVVEFSSAEFGNDKSNMAAEEKEDEKKLHFSLGWTSDVTAFISEVQTNGKGRQQPKVVTRQDKQEKVLIKSVTIDGKPFEHSDYEFDFKVGVMIKVSDGGRVDLTLEEARLYDVLNALTVSEQNELIEWAIKEAKEADDNSEAKEADDNNREAEHNDFAAREAEHNDFDCDSSNEVTLEEDSVEEEELLSDLEDLEIPAVFTQVVTQESNYLGSNVVAFSLDGNQTSAIVQKNRTTINRKHLSKRDALEDFASPGLSVTISKLEHIEGYCCPYLATINVTTQDLNKSLRRSEDSWSKEEMEELIYARSVAERIESSRFTPDKEADRVGFWKAVRSLEAERDEWNGFGYNEAVNVDSVQNLLKLQTFRKLPETDLWPLNDLGGEILTQNDEKKASVGVIGDGDRKVGVIGDGDRKVGVIGDGDRKVGIIGDGDRKVGIIGDGDRKVGVIADGDRKVGVIADGDRKVGLIGDGDKRDDVVNGRALAVTELQGDKGGRDEIVMNIQEDLLETNKMVKEIKMEVLSADSPQNLVLDKLDVLFQRLSKMEDRLESSLSHECEVGSDNKRQVGSQDKWQVGSQDKSQVGKIQEVQSKELSKKITRDQSTQTIVTGNIMFFKYTTDA